MKTWPFKMIQETFFKDVEHVEEITAKTKNKAICNRGQFICDKINSNLSALSINKMKK